MVQGNTIFRIFGTNIGKNHLSQFNEWSIRYMK